MANLVEITVKVDGDKDIIVRMKRITDESKRNADESSSAWSKLRNAFTGGNGQGGILGSINNVIGGIPKVGSGFASLGPASLPALAAVTAAVVALVGYVSAVIPELVAAGAGFAAFAALAYPSITKILDGVTAIGAATTKVARDKAWDAIPAALQPAVKTILEVKKAFDDMAKSLQPLVGRIAATVGDIVKKILPDIKPLAVETGRAIEGLLKQFDKVASSAGFKSFMAELTKLSGPAITAIGQGIGQVGAALATFLKDLMSPNGLITLRVMFTIIAGSIRALGVVFQAAGKWGSMFASGMLSAFRIAVSAAHVMVDSILTAISGLLHAFAAIPGPQQAALKASAMVIDNYRRSVDNSFNSAQRTLQAWKTALANAPKIVKLQGDITDLQTKLAIANQQLRNPNLTATRRARIEANIDNLRMNIARARAELQALQGLTITTYISTIRLATGGSGGAGGHPVNAPATGGITGYATGGLAGSLAMVGEHGRELISTPPGTRVWSNPDTERMMAQQGGTWRLVVSMDPQMPRGLSRELIRWLKFTVRTQGGGSAQVAFGSD